MSSELLENWNSLPRVHIYGIDFDICSLGMLTLNAITRSERRINNKKVAKKDFFCVTDDNVSSVSEDAKDNFKDLSQEKNKFINEPFFKDKGNKTLHLKKKVDKVLVTNENASNRALNQEKNMSNALSLNDLQDGTLKQENNMKKISVLENIRNRKMNLENNINKVSVLETTRNRTVNLKNNMIKVSVLGTIRNRKLYPEKYSSWKSNGDGILDRTLHSRGNIIHKVSVAKAIIDKISYAKDVTDASTHEKNSTLNEDKHKLVNTQVIMNGSFGSISEQHFDNFRNDKSENPVDDVDHTNEECREAVDKIFNKLQKSLLVKENDDETKSNDKDKFNSEKRSANVNLKKCMIFNTLYHRTDDVQDYSHTSFRRGEKEFCPESEDGTDLEDLKHREDAAALKGGEGNDDEESNRGTEDDSGSQKKTSTNKISDWFEKIFRRRFN